MQKRKDRRLWYANPVLYLALFIVAFSVAYVASLEPATREISYGELMQILQAADPAVRFENVRVGKNEIRGHMVIRDTILKGAGEAESKKEVLAFVTRSGLPVDPVLLTRLNERAGPFYQAEGEQSTLTNVGSTVLFLAFFLSIVLAGFFIFKYMAGGNSPFSFGRSRHRLYAEQDLKITFADVAGIDEAVAELREIVDFLKTPERYQALGGRIPKGVLLVGPPGTGKTLLAKAVAGEADVPFFSMSGSDFVEMFVGVGASRVRDLFGQAESRAPCIIFIDELDALGKMRGGSMVGSHDEREQTLNALLVEMDGFDSDRGVIIMAATNRPEMLDAALLRPGRFDRTVVVDRPDIGGREAILRVHVRDVRLADNVDLRHVAALTPGLAGADLANLVNEAALLAARKNKSAVEMADFDEAIERGTVGLERKSRLMHADEKQRVAYHEAGHALVACALPNTHPVHKVSIIPRGVGALGYVLRRPEEDRYLMTRNELESQIKVALGGTIAEELIYREISNGATSDLENATQIARAMVMEFGMSQLGRVSYHERGRGAYLSGSAGEDGERKYSEETAREIDLEIRKIIDESLAEVRRILTERRHALVELAEHLIEKEVIDGADLRRLLARLLPPEEVPDEESQFRVTTAAL